MRYTLKRDDMPLLSQWIKKYREQSSRYFLARVVGFEPTSHGVRIRCLTAWRYPNIGAFSIVLLWKKVNCFPGTFATKVKGFLGFHGKFAVAFVAVFNKNSTTFNLLVVCKNATPWCGFLRVSRKNPVDCKRNDCAHRCAQNAQCHCAGNFPLALHGFPFEGLPFAFQRDNVHGLLIF